VITRVLPADATGIAEAARLLAAGELVAFPTETVYGLGADATNPRAVASIFAAKGRPHFNPLICHFPALAAVEDEVELDAAGRTLAQAFWPGPLSLVAPRRAGSRIAQLAGAGLETLAVRIPAHPVALALLAACGVPVAAPSANRSGQVSPTHAAHVLDGLSGRIALVLDGGPCPVGVESTVLDVAGSPPVLLRPGGATAEAFAVRACWFRTMRRCCRYGSMRPTRGRTRRCWRSARPRRVPRSHSSFRKRARWTRPPPTCSRACAGWMPPGGRKGWRGSPP
jgi:L-threonylcarbamoyladenylate synthase